MKIVQNALFMSCGARFGQIAFLSVKVLNIVKLAANSFQNWKTVRFSWKLYKTLFQVTRGTFWPNRILERQSFQNRETRLKFSSRRKNSALSMKIVQNALFTSCGARFAQMAFLSIKVLKIVTLAPNPLQNRKIVRFLWKLYKTLFSGHAEHVLAKSHFWALKFLKSLNWLQILFKTGKQCAFHKNCIKRRFRSRGARFGQIAFWSVKVLKIVTLAWNSCRNGKTVPFPSKSYKNGHFMSCAARFGQIAFWSVKVLKIVKLASNSLQNGKTVRFSLTM